MDEFVASFMVASPRTKNTETSLYERDFFEWTQEEAAKLRRFRPAGLDVENLAEEIESLGKRDRRKLRSHLVVILAHLLKWEHQPERRSRSWVRSVRNGRQAISYVIEDSPSLRDHPATILRSAFEEGRGVAADEMGCDENELPTDCPYTIGQSLDDHFWPGPEEGAFDRLPSE